MIVDLSKCVKLSPNSRAKVINDFYPDLKDVVGNKDYSDSELSLHAGALCLYAATMLTNIYDKTQGQSVESLSEIELESNDRETAYYEVLKTMPKYSSSTDEEIKNMAHKMVLVDIRNSFAHGNFKLNYSIHTKKLYFVLLPQRKGLNVNEPIVISKNSLKKALTKTLTVNALKYRMLSESSLKYKVKNSINGPLQELMLPTELMKLADNYLEKAQRTGAKYAINEKRGNLVQYILLVTQITYEQDDYYQIFGKDSNIFNKIAVVRNANAHSNLVFGNLAKRITYVDRDKTLEESFRKSITSLLIASQLKTDILPLVKEGRNPEAVENLKTELSEAFDYFFTDGGDMLSGIRKFCEKHRDEIMGEQEVNQ